MTSRLDLPTLRLRSPGELLDAVPYLLGFHPQESLVLIGLEGSLLVVTARLDLTDAAVPEVLDDAVAAIHRGGATDLVAVVYASGPAADSVAALPWAELADRVMETADDLGCVLIDALLVGDRRWWSYTCAETGCCPASGRPLPSGTSEFSAAATYAGLVALPDRAALEATLEPRPEAERAALQHAISEWEHRSVQAILDGHSARHERSVKRALFAAARAADEPTWASRSALDDATVARFGVALSGHAIRDSVWMAVDDGRLDGRQLWRELAARLPSPYDAAPLFLFAWCSWRAGNGAIAGIAAERALASDPHYSAADLLLAALHRGVDPRRLPRLRLPRPA